MIFTASLHPCQTSLLQQLSFSSQRVTGEHILQDPLVTVSRSDWGTSTVKCLLSIAKAAPPVPATRGAESSYIPDPLSHPSLLLLHLLLHPQCSSNQQGSRSLHLASLTHPQPPSRAPSPSKQQQRRLPQQHVGNRNGNADLLRKGGLPSHRPG